MVQTSQQKLDSCTEILPATHVRSVRRATTSEWKAVPAKKLRLNEADIKAAILSLPSVRRGKPVVASEFVVGRRVRRADLVIQGAVLTAFEIKSDFDNLNRLSAQVDEYAKHFCKVVVVLVAKHVEKAMLTLDNSIEVWEISPDLSIKIRREAHGCRYKDPRDLLRLLTKSEHLRYIGKELGPDLFESEISRAQGAVEKAFISRHGFYSQLFWKAVGRKKVSPTHLVLLSRFHEGRKKAAAQTAKNEEFWRSWHLDTAKFFDTEGGRSPDQTLV